MTDSDHDTGTKDQAEGGGNQIAGRAEQAWGGITGDREAQGKGMLDEAKGKIQQGVGDLKDKIAQNDDK